MQQSSSQSKIHGETLPIDLDSPGYLPVFYTKNANILQMQSQSRKRKQLIHIENELRKNREQYEKVNSQILYYEAEARQKRKSAIKTHLAEIQKRKQFRQLKNKWTNQILAKVKDDYKQRRSKMQSILNSFKEEHELDYRQKIANRKSQMKLDMENIKDHELQYMQSKIRRISCRIKTQNSCRHDSDLDQIPEAPTKRRHCSPTLMNNYVAKIQKAKELVKRRKEYGESAERAAGSIKISIDMVRKVKNYNQKHGFDPNIDLYQLQKRKMQKPKLNTNLSGDIDQLQQKQITKIAYGHDGSTTEQKMARLSNLADGLKVHYQNGKDEVLDKICNVNLRRAQLLLKVRQSKSSHHLKPK